MKIKGVYLALVPHRPIPDMWSFEIRACLHCPHSPSKNDPEIFNATTILPPHIQEYDDAISVMDIMVDSLVVEFKRKLREMGRAPRGREGDPGC